MNELKNYIKSDLNEHTASEYLYDLYKEPAQIIAYNDAYQIVEAISKGKFSGENEQPMLRKDKSEKMTKKLTEMLTKELPNQNKKIHFGANEVDFNNRTCLQSCIIF